MTAPSCPSCGAPVTPEVVDGIVRNEHRCDPCDVCDCTAFDNCMTLRRATRGLAPEVW